MWKTKKSLKVAAPKKFSSIFLFFSRLVQLSTVLRPNFLPCCDILGKKHCWDGSENLLCMWREAMTNISSLLASQGQFRRPLIFIHAYHLWLHFFLQIIWITQRVHLNLGFPFFSKSYNISFLPSFFLNFLKFLKFFRILSQIFLKTYIHEQEMKF